MIKYIIYALLIFQILTKTDLYVGYSDKNNNFKTVQEAVNKAASIRPSTFISIWQTLLRYWWLIPWVVISEI